MSDKAVQKREYIIEKAREIFVEKGYKNVTMKDIVEGCEISRGGLYLYFENTSEIFLEVLRKESEDSDDVFQKKMTDKATPADIFILFLKEQKRELLRKKDNLSVAVYEYFFDYKGNKKDNYLGRQFSYAVKVLEKLLEACVSSGEFTCEDALGTARNIMYIIEGMKITAQTFGLTEAAVDKEFGYIIKNLVIEEN